MGKNFKALMKGLQFGGRNLLGTFVLLPDALKNVFKNPNFSKTRKGLIFLAIFTRVAIKLTPPGAAAFFVVDTIKGARKEKKNLVLNEMGTAMNLRDLGYTDDGAAKISGWLCRGDADALEAALDNNQLCDLDKRRLFDMMLEEEGSPIEAFDVVYDTPLNRQVPTRLNKNLNPFHRRRINQEEAVGF
jgi:hypothetical protein